MKGWTIRSGCALVALLVFARPAAACSPIVSLTFLYTGPTMGAIALGAGLGLALVVAVKCGTFAVLYKDIRPARAAALMFVANIVTALLGLGIALIPASGGPLIVLLPFVIWLAMCTARHLDRKGPVAAVLVALFVLSFFLWGLAEATWSSSAAAFWGLKVAYTACAVTFGFVMTAAWEAYLVHKWSLREPGSEEDVAPRGRLARARVAAETEARLRPGRRILHAAAWANVVAFGLVALAGAAVAIPLRLQHPEFLYLAAKRIVAALA